MSDAPECGSCGYTADPACEICSPMTALRSQVSELRADLEVANAKLSGVHSAVMEYLPPDGIDAKQCISRILAVIDNEAG